jgi:hypothetical protein
MPFYLNVANAGSDRRPADGRVSADESAAPARGPFIRGLLIGFASAFVVFDWLFTGGAIAHSAARTVQQFIGLRG